MYMEQNFEQYVYGRQVKVETDHKPIESIMKKNLLSAPKRLQRMLLRLQKYQLEVTYKKGSQMYLADTLSRAYLKGSTRPQEHAESVLATESGIEKDLESIDMVCNLAIVKPSHVGVHGCLRRARETVYWPRMTKELTEYISR